MGVTARDESPKPVATSALDLRLQGILYSSKDPTASINNQLVHRNVPTTLKLEGGELRVKAVEITRDRVILEVEGRQVELRMNAPPVVKGGS
jgi:type II secretory pathway component PulC